MKRILGAAATAATAAVLAGASMWLAGAPAYAGPAAADSAGTSIRVVPGWTYQGSGKIAVIVACPSAKDLPVVFSTMLGGGVDMRTGGDLLIEVTDRTEPGKYGIDLECEASGRQVVSFGAKPVQILGMLAGWKMRPAPSLPAGFKPDVTVRSVTARRP